ncbi:putative thyroid hormone receptor interactor 12 [Operophtera brumata]|uniref:Putative thyroid hormone receptor interactor 12 n=1 Tax=Operophtera brumata TaxID=104452 RepID=A0A0L7L5M3_OPEBR|nr:putative thyroid hormone receptor interactor 12 [Operophtera brumata]
MSGDAASLPCPICSHTGVFDSAESLRDRLIHVSTNNILCPVCQEDICGLDKLTIHLFSHVKCLVSENQTAERNKATEKKGKLKPENEAIFQQKKPRSAAKNKPSSSIVSAPVKYVRIYPKLPVISLNPVPIIDISQKKPSEEYVKTCEQLMVKTEAQVVQTNTICDICGLQFVDKNILKMHRCLIHNIDDTPSESFTRHNCHLCPKHFKMRGSLMVHLRVAHYAFLSENGNNDNDSQDKTDGKKTDQLQEKSSSFDRNDNKQWQCDVCRKYFTTKYFLKKHKRLHTGKCFRQRVSYLVHRRIHTGVMPYKCTACEKNFRYKVSQRTHKCQAQPPGTVIRQTGDLVEKLKKKHTDPSNLNYQQQNDDGLNHYPEISEANAELARTGAKLSLEDMETDNFRIFAETFSNNAESHCTTSSSADFIGGEIFSQKSDHIFETNIEELTIANSVDDKNVPSPSDILRNLSLSKDDDFSLTEERSNDIIKEFSDYL